MPTPITKILVYAEEHANALAKKYPTLVAAAKSGGGYASAATTVGVWVFTHPKNDQATLSAAKKHLEDNGHTHKVE